MEIEGKYNQYTDMSNPTPKPTPAPTIPIGKFFRAAAHPDLQKTRPMAVFVPDSLINNGVLNLVEYQTQRWHSINAGTQALAVGSHLFPDISQPVESSPELEKALLQMIQKSAGKPTQARRPGKLGQEMEMQ